MEFVRGLENYSEPGNGHAIATIGTFDGIHLGHRAILERVQQEAQRDSLIPVLVTFHPHPQVVLSPHDAPQLLTTIEEKEQFLPDYFSGKVLILKFDDQLRNLSAEDFVRSILVDKVGIRKLIVGDNHALGKDREGNSKELARLSQKYGFELEVVGPILLGEKAVSSSRIRAALLGGNFEESINLLGHQYAIFGKVMRGMGLGKKLGFPTANVEYNSRKLLPTEGVYGCWAKVNNEKKDGVMFIGKNYFNPEGGISVEANLFDFDEEIYGREIFVYPTHFVRENKRFDSTEALKKQMIIDKEIVIRNMKEEKSNVSEQRAKSSNYCR